jgi:ribonuclease BN (tRNA processing enzyme)
VVSVTVLGSGDAFASGGRAHSAYLVEAPGTTFLLDCGPTVLQSLKRARADSNRVDFVLLSHLHGDHFGGLPFLFLEYRYENPRRRPLTVYGPKGTARRVPALYRALYEQVAQKPPPFPVVYEEVRAGRPFTAGVVRITPLVVPHSPELVCHAYRIETGEKTIFYSGDTSWTDELLVHARGADLFLCECSTYETRLDIHLSYPEIAARAQDFGCKRLVLTHLGREPLAHLPDLSLECAEDGMRIDLA